MRRRLKRAALWVWQKVPFPRAVRWAMLWILNTKYLVGVTAVVLNDAGDVLLLRHTYRLEWAWGLPAGWLRGREDPVAAVGRELEEESGLRARVLYPLAVQPVGDRPQLDVIYLCRPAGGTFRPSAEVAACGWFSPEDLPPLPPDQVDTIRRAVAVRAMEAGVASEGGAGPPP